MRGMGGMPQGAMRGMGGMQSRPMGMGTQTGEGTTKKIIGKPFTLSGAFSTTALDGWTGGGSRSTSGFRSSPSCLSLSNGAIRSLFIPAAVARHTRITVGMWSTPQAAATNIRRLSYQIGTAETASGASSSNTNAGTYSYMEFTFDNKKDDDVIISAACPTTTGAYFDDWTISGVPL